MPSDLILGDQSHFRVTFVDAPGVYAPAPHEHSTVQWVGQPSERPAAVRSRLHDFFAFVASGGGSMLERRQDT